MLADDQLRAGRNNDAAVALDQAEAAVRSSSDLIFASENSRVRAAIARTVDASSALIEAELSRALQRASAFVARPGDLRANHDIATLYAHQAMCAKRRMCSYRRSMGYRATGTIPMSAARTNCLTAPSS